MSGLERAIWIGLCRVPLHCCQLGLGRQRQQCGLAAANRAAASWRAKRLYERTLHKHRMERPMSAIGQAVQENRRRLGALCSPSGPTGIEHSNNQERVPRSRSAGFLPSDCDNNLAKPMPFAFKKLNSIGRFSESKASNISTTFRQAVVLCQSSVVIPSQWVFQSLRSLQLK